jgi:hypothetical protein
VHTRSVGGDAALRSAASSATSQCTHFVSHAAWPASQPPFVSYAKDFAKGSYYSDPPLHTMPPRQVSGATSESAPALSTSTVRALLVELFGEAEARQVRTEHGMLSLTMPLGATWRHVT